MYVCACWGEGAGIELGNIRDGTIDSIDEHMRLFNLLQTEGVRFVS